MMTGGSDDRPTFTVNVDQESGAVMAPSPALDPAMYGGQGVVEVINVDPDAAGTGWNPSPFQAESWHAYLRDQAAVRTALKEALAASFADRITDGGGTVWATFKTDTVYLPDDRFELATRPDRRAMLERFRIDPTEIEQMLDGQEVQTLDGRRTAYDVWLRAAGVDVMWTASFRDGEQVTLAVEV